MSGSMKTKRAIGNAITYAVLIILSIIWLFPFVCLILQSFRSMNEGGGGMVDYLLPKQFSLDSYTWLFSADSKFVRWYGNTLVIAIFVSVLQTIVVLCVSYALSRMRFKGREFLMRFW